MTAVASLSIAARATLNLHSLNNEGGEGNQIQTRMCDVVDASGELRSVNAISGDMMRHMVAEQLFRIALQRGLPLSEGARLFDPNRINVDKPAMKAVGETGSDRDALDYILQRCAVTDIMGTLITESKRSLPRKSVLEFGWVIGIPDRVRSDSYFHVKYSPDRGSAEQRQQQLQGATDDGSNRGQAIFHRPASSGVYAIVCHLELARIGFNDISQTYSCDVEERIRRAGALLDAVLYSFLELNGAMRSAQLPHLSALEGVVSTSSGVLPAPLVSPLMQGEKDGDDYRTQIEGIKDALNGQSGSEVGTQRFDSVARFAQTLRRISDELQLASFVPDAREA